MDEQTAIQRSTSILELLYLVKAKNRGDFSFEEFMALASDWAEAVIVEYEEKQELVLTSRDVSGKVEG